ncbi:MAG: hypothetical protein KC478_12250 [Bacteriovoracaceae bacterium]|nr:hypothetical protein [Bacteriovoracaceae bacterium]
MKFIALIFIPFIFLNSCASESKRGAKNPFNPITLKETLHKGSTTQKMILNKFGAPNITSQDADKTETWVYSKSSMSYEDGTMGAGAIAWLGIPVVGDIFGSQSSAEMNSKSVNLTLNFDSKKVLQDYKVVRTQM